TSATTQTVSVDITANSCQTGAAVITTGGNGGGGGGGSATAPKTTTKTTPEPATTTTEKPISQMTVNEVKAKIAEITQIILQLQAQLVEMLGGSAASVSGALPETNLKLGSSGEAVRLLQTWLAKDLAVYPEGIISGYFGSLTKAAVIKFQEKYKADILDPWNFTSGTGIVGPTTRAKLSELFGSQ
ncbi:peptidoglycan-binding protein, partial [Candidatus Parcubacteria bacterium]|nr:peptidoglycan-binding protein [Candidatus Parcubacteria bacterium]